MLLAELVESFKNELTPVSLVPGWETLEIDRVTINSNRVTPTSVFVACKGVLPTSKDGHEFIAKAIEQGAAAVVLEQAPVDVSNWALPVWQSGNSRVDAARLAASVSGHPDRELTTVGITGTNGKSSVAFALSSLLTHLGRSCAVMGTLGVGRPDALEDWGMTTPEAEVLSSRLRQLIEQKFDAVAMEVSSHGLATARVAGLQFDVSLFTNLSHEHLDFHETFEAYYQAKKSLFTAHTAPSGVFVLPHEGDLGRRLAKDLSGLPHRCVTWGRDVGADVRASEVRLSARGIQMRIDLPTGAFPIEVPWIGDFHVDNLLAVAATGYALGYDASALQDAFRSVSAPPGRMQRVPAAPEQATVLVDYAHTPDALESALKTLQAVCPGNLWVVFGCGGDRDVMKRPLMGRWRLGSPIVP